MLRYGRKIKLYFPKNNCKKICANYCIIVISVVSLYNKIQQGDKKMLRVIHSNIDRVEEPKKKRVPLWKDEAALARGLREFIEEHNAKFKKQLSK